MDIEQRNSNESIPVDLDKSILYDSRKLERAILEKQARYQWLLLKYPEIQQAMKLDITDEREAPAATDGSPLLSPGQIKEISDNTLRKLYKDMVQTEIAQQHLVEKLEPVRKRNLELWKKTHSEEIKERQQEKATRYLH